MDTQIWRQGHKGHEARKYFQRRVGMEEDLSKRTIFVEIKKEPYKITGRNDLPDMQKKLGIERIIVSLDNDVDLTFLPGRDEYAQPISMRIEGGRLAIEPSTSELIPNVLELAKNVITGLGRNVLQHSNNDSINNTKLLHKYGVFLDKIRTYQ